MNKPKPSNSRNLTIQEKTIRLRLLTTNHTRIETQELKKDMSRKNKTLGMIGNRKNRRKKNPIKKNTTL